MTVVLENGHLPTTTTWQESELMLRNNELHQSFPNFFERLPESR